MTVKAPRAPLYTPGFMDHGETADPCPRCGYTLKWVMRAGGTFALACQTKGCAEPEKNAGRRQLAPRGSDWPMVPDARVWD